jgi:hypothetical protein
VTRSLACGQSFSPLSGGRFYRDVVQRPAWPTGGRDTGRQLRWTARGGAVRSVACRDVHGGTRRRHRAVRARRAALDWGRRGYGHWRMGPTEGLVMWGVGGVRSLQFGSG